MIFMGTQTIPYSKAEEWGKIFLKVTAAPFPSCIKKWQTFTCHDGEHGLKGYNLIFTEKGVDEAVVEIGKVISPFWEIEGYGWKLEPLLGISDSFKVLEKGR